MIRKDHVAPDRFEPVADARVESPVQLSIALLLLVIGIVPLFSIMWYFRALQLNDFVALVLLGTFVFAVVETFAIIILWGMKRLDLPPTFAHWLGAATVGEIATLLTIVVKKLF